MDRKYTVIVKTGEAEIRALENTSRNLLQCILPVIEITRGRKITKNEIETYPFDKRLLKLKKVFQGQTVCLDLTSDDSLSSDEISYLYDPTNGYQNWINFLLQIKSENIFKEIIPTLILNLNDDDFEANLLLQVQNIKMYFDSILYRNDISDENCYDDFELIKQELADINFYVLLDCGYTPQASYRNVALKCIARIKNLHSILDDRINYIVCSTSFPNNVRDLGDVDSDTFSISEIDIYNLISEQCSNIIYGDYASINPVRNDTITMARGWIPRIDTPLERSIFYYKQRRPKGVSAYASTYIQVAQQTVRDSRFPKAIEDNWGVEQIRSCAKGGAPSSSPSFWISVRMNIYIEQQIKRIYSY